MGRCDRWQEATFTNAVNNGKITQDEWNIAMGKKCTKHDKVLPCVVCDLDSDLAKIIKDKCRN